MSDKPYSAPKVFHPKNCAECPLHMMCFSGAFRETSRAWPTTALWYCPKCQRLTPEFVEEEELFKVACPYVSISGELWHVVTPDSGPAVNVYASQCLDCTRLETLYDIARTPKNE